MFKKVFMFVAAFLLAVTFAGCTNDNSQTDSGSGNGNGELNSGATVGGGNNNNDNGNNSSNGGTVNPDASILIAYFSWSGHTQQLAEVIHEQVGGDIFVITPKVPYTTDINKLSGQASQELRDNVRPELASHVENFADYDVIFVGYPNWWSNAPMPVFTFLEEYDFEGKTIVPFTVYGNTGFGNSISSIKKSAPDATVLDGYSVQEHSMQNVNQEVTSWLQKIGITK